MAIAKPACKNHDNDTTSSKRRQGIERKRALNLGADLATGTKGTNRYRQPDSPGRMLPKVCTRGHPRKSHPGALSVVLAKYMLQPDRSNKPGFGYKCSHYKKYPVV